MVYWALLYVAGDMVICMKKYIFTVFLCALTVLIVFSSRGHRVGAADSLRGSLGSIGEVTEKMLTKAAKLTGDVDVDAEFEKAFAKKKWNKDYTKEDLKYMACIIFAEARSMSFDARAAVGNVVLNRLYSTNQWSYLNGTSIKRVIYDTGPDGKWWGVQFSPTKDGNMDKALKVYANLDKGTNTGWDEQAMKSAIEVAKAVLKGYRSVPESFMYFNGYVSTQPASCEKNGWDYIIYEKHVYYNKTSD